jgi:hypothetical protein
MKIDDIWKSIKDLCCWSYTGFVPTQQQWTSIIEALAEMNDDTDWNTFLYTLAKHKGWSSRTNMWKLLRDKFAPDYKKWLRQKKKEGENRQLTLYDIFDKEKQ